METFFQRKNVQGKGMEVESSNQHNNKPWIEKYRPKNLD